MDNSTEKLNKYEKGLFTQIINYSKSKNYKFILSTENFVICIPNNEEKAICFKKVDEAWERNLFTEEKALSIFNLQYTENGSFNEDETDIVDPIEKINCTLFFDNLIDKIKLIK